LEDSFDVNQLKRLVRYIAPYKKKMAGVVFLMLSSSALIMLLPIFFQKVMDVCIPNKDMRSIILYGIFTLLIASYSAVSLRLKIYTMSRVGQSIVHQLRSDIFGHLQELPFSYFDDRPHGKIQVRVVNYVNSLSDLLSNGIVNTLTDMCNLIFIILFMLYLDVRLTLVCLCGLPVLAVVIFTIKKRQRRAWQIQSNKQSNLNAYIAESINGIRVTQSFVREDENTGIFNRLSASYRAAWMRAIMFNFALGPCVDLISNISIAAIYVLGVQWILAPVSTMTVGVLFAFSAYIGRFWAPINTLTNFSVSKNDRLTEFQKRSILDSYADDKFFENIKWYKGFTDIFDLERLGCNVYIHSNCLTEATKEAKYTEIVDKLGFPSERVALNVISDPYHKDLDSDIYILVDDSPFNLANSKAKYNIALRKPWNTSDIARGIIGEKNVIYCNTFIEVLDTIQNILNKAE